MKSPVAYYHNTPYLHDSNIKFMKLATDYPQIVQHLGSSSDRNAISSINDSNIEIIQIGSGKLDLSNDKNCQIVDLKTSEKSKKSHSTNRNRTVKFMSEKMVKIVETTFYR